VEDAYTQADATIAAREDPGIAVRGVFAAHDQVEFILGIVGCIHIIFGPVSISVKGLTHRGTYTYMAREATRIDGDGSAHGIALIDMILNGYATDAIIFYEGLLDGMIYAEDGSSGHRPARQMLVDATYIQYTGDPRIIVKGNLAVWRDKIDCIDRMIEVFWDIERLHIAHPASAARMNGVTNFVLALQDEHVRTLARGGFASRQTGGSTTYD
jgi:hypothetical protein